MSPVAQLPIPPSKFDIFMEKFGWPTITLIVGTVLAGVIIAIWLGKIQVIDFSWIMLVLGCLMFVILAFLIWYGIKTRQKLQEQYAKYIAEIKRDSLTFKNDTRRMREEETHDWHEWAVSFSKQSDKEHRERTEELKRQCMEAIHDAELSLDVSVKNSLSIFKTAQETCGIIIDQYRDQLIHEMRRMDAIEEHFKSKISPDDQE